MLQNEADDAAVSKFICRQGPTPFSFFIKKFHTNYCDNYVL